MSFVALWLGVGLLGGVGAIARFAVDRAISSAAGSRLPVGTMVVNLTGAAVLGLLVGAAVRGDAYLLAGTAVIGSYTTFSTWELESQRLAEEGLTLQAFANIGVGLALGLGAAVLGQALGGL